MSMLSALTNSINPAAVGLAEKVGYPRVIGVARQLGITGEIGEYPAMVLGSNEKTMLEMVAAYAAINNRGVYVEPTPFDEIYGPDGELLWSRRIDTIYTRSADLRCYCKELSLTGYRRHCIDIWPWIYRNSYRENSTISTTIC
jgi:membrane peptidoglycan carboxypeptidase